MPKYDTAKVNAGVRNFREYYAALQGVLDVGGPIARHKQYHSAINRCHRTTPQRPRCGSCGCNQQVEPSHTSQRCSRTDCGFTHEDNRHEEQFKCQKCGYEVNADYNGAKNIGLRYARKRTHRLRSSPKSGGRRRRSRPAYNWWDVERQESPAYCRRLIAGSPHQSPITRNRRFLVSSQNACVLTTPSRTEARSAEGVGWGSLLGKSQTAVDLSPE